VATKVKFDPQELLDDRVAEIDEALEEVERRMRPYAKLNETKQQLLAARRALLGHGPRTTGGTSQRLHLDDIVGFLKENPGSTPAAIAERFGVTQPTVSSHIYRNKSRFIKKGDGYYVRDPKAGMNTEDDIEDDDE
jgi:hypothetical protein